MLITKMAIGNQVANSQLLHVTCYNFGGGTKVKHAIKGVRLHIRLKKQIFVWNPVTQGNPCFKAYNLGWQNHPNFS